MLPSVLTGSMVVAGVVLAGLAAYVWRRRGAPAGLSLAVLLLSAAWWAAAYALELSSVDLAVRGRWGDLKYLGIGLVAPAYLVFVLQYTGRGHLVTRRWLALLAIEPVTVWVLLAVPPAHDLVRFYTDETVSNEVPGVGAGPAFWPHLVYANVMILAATVLFVLKMARLSHVYRVAAGVLVAAVLLPWAANLLYNFQVGPFARMDLTPFAFILGGAVLVWGLYRQRLINLSSLAWGLVVQIMPDGVVLRDAFGRVSDANPAAVRLLGRPRTDLVGRDLSELITNDTPLGPTRGRGAGPWDAAETHVSVALEDGIRHIDLRFVPLWDLHGARSGELVMLRDITAAKESEATLRNLLDERTRIAATLQSSLRPARLPSVPGCRLAAWYEPAGDGHEIGGDFYDVFPIDEHRWGIVLGDVSGKGAAAAAVTALIRYTLRTLAADDVEPDEVLRKLNGVLLRDEEPERFCTLVYAVARVSAAGLDLRLCLAGHHRPLLRRCDGGVEPVGVLGTVLGLFPDPELAVEALHLDPGDLFLLFTDGLVEARNGDDQFGVERVVSLLSQSDRAHAHQDALTCPQLLLDHVAAAAHGFHNGPLADDLALLALRVHHETPSGSDLSRGGAAAPLPPLPDEGEDDRPGEGPEDAAGA